MAEFQGGKRTLERRVLLTLMRLALVLISLMAAPHSGPRDAGMPTAPDAGVQSEDSALLGDLELIENMEVLELLEELDVGQ